LIHLLEGYEGLARVRRGDRLKGQTPGSCTNQNGVGALRSWTKVGDLDPRTTLRVRRPSGRPRVDAPRSSSR
jgi:hypothetical protein